VALARRAVRAVRAKRTAGGRTGGRTGGRPGKCLARVRARKLEVVGR
jgi:hypothetical protein